MSRRALTLLCILSLTTPLLAGELWLEATPPRPAAGESVSIALRSDSERTLARLDLSRFQHLNKRSRKNIDLDGDEPLVMKFAAAGVELLAVAATDPASDAERFAKALIVVDGASSGGTLHWSEVGQRLEIVPQTDPVLLARNGGGLTVQVLYEREPLAGARVVAIPVGADEATRTAATDEIGLARLRLDLPGLWRLEVVHDTTCGECQGGLRRLRSSLTLPAGP